MLFKEDAAARAEANAVRTNAAWYRWTHDLIDVTGSDAAAFLDWIYVNTIAKSPVGRTKYTCSLNEEGKLIDDCIVMHMGEDHYWISTLYGPHFIRWADAHKGSWQVSYRDITKEVDMYAIQGPNSAEVVNDLIADTVDSMKRFSVFPSKAAGVDVQVHRSGFTGENGYEIYCAMGDTEKVRDAISASAEKFDVPELQILEVYVRSIPVEKGFALRQDMYQLTPYECGMAWMLHPDEKDFIGREAVLRAKENGPKHQLVGFELDPSCVSYEDIAQREIIYHKGIPCGFVRTCIYGYTVDKNIGFAVVDANVPIGTEVTIGCNDAPAILTEKNWL